MTKKSEKQKILDKIAKPRDESVSLSAEEYLKKKEQYTKEFFVWEDEMAFLKAKLIDDDWAALSKEEKEKYLKLKKENMEKIMSGK